MSAAENAQRVQAAAWQTVAALPDVATTTPEDLAGWAHVARAAAPLLEASGRAELAQSLTQTARAIPARPAAAAHPTGHLMELSRAVEDLRVDLEAEPAAREAGAEVVATAVQAAAMTGAEHANEAPNPQVRALSTQLAGVATAARAATTDARTRAITSRAPAAQQETTRSSRPAQHQTRQRATDVPTAPHRGPSGPNIK